MDSDNNIAGDGYRYRAMLQVILSLLLFSCNGDYLKYNKHLIIGGWKFAIGDKSEYAATTYNDSNWSAIDVTTYWESQGYKGYDGYGWYRAKVFIPSSLVRNASMKDSLKLYLGKVDDYDQVYLNGRLLGENNLTICPPYTLPYRSFVDKPTKYDIQRKYRIPLDDERILWDKENLIAVRVFDENANGGIYSHISPYIAMTGLEDYVLFKKESFYEVDKYGNVNTSLVIKNSSRLSLQGSITILRENIEKKMEIYKTERIIELKPLEEKELLVYIPVCTDSIKVSFIYTDNKYKAVIYDDKTIPYSLVPSEDH